MERSNFKLFIKLNEKKTYIHAVMAHIKCSTKLLTKVYSKFLSFWMQKIETDTVDPKIVAAIHNQNSKTIYYLYALELIGMMGWCNILVQPNLIKILEYE